MFDVFSCNVLCIRSVTSATQAQKTKLLRYERELISLCELHPQWQITIRITRPITKIYTHRPLPTPYVLEQLPSKLYYQLRAHVNTLTIYRVVGMERRHGSRGTACGFSTKLSQINHRSIVHHSRTTNPQINLKYRRGVNHCKRNIMWNRYTVRRDVPD